MWFRSVLQQIRHLDAKTHEWLLARFPRFVAHIESGLFWLVDGVLGSPIFAVVLALVLFVLAVASPHSVVAIAMSAAWLISFFGIAKSRGIRRLTIISRSVVLLILAGILALVAIGFTRWALKQYDDQHRGHLHILRFFPFDMEAEKQYQLNIYYENTGDQPVAFKAMSQEVVVNGLLTHPESDLKVTENGLFQHLLSDFPKSAEETLTVSGHGNAWVTMPAPWVFSKEDVSNIESGDALILTVGVLRYEERPARQDVEFCVLWGRKSAVVISCSVHNRE